MNAISIPANSLPSTEISANFDKLSEGGNFLGTLQLYSKGKPIDQGLIGPGRFGVKVSDTEIQDLGPTVDVVPLARRAKAIDFADRDQIITVYDDTSEEFQRIQAASAEQDSGCMFGISFLVFERQTGRFLELFFGTKSTRPEAKNVYGFLPKANEEGNLVLQEMTLKAKYIEKQKFSWHVPTVHKCSTPITNMPSGEVITAEITKFVNPKVAEVEVVAPAAKSKRKR